MIGTSVLIAILFDEPERRALTNAIEAARVCRASAMSKLEASMVAITEAEPMLFKGTDFEASDVEVVGV